jgi:hypothetical protein
VTLRHPTVADIPRAVRSIETPAPSARRASLPALALAPLLVLVTLTACGGARLRGSEYRDDEAHYFIGDVSPRWSQLEAPGDNDLAWHDGEAGAVIQVNSTCDPGADIPLTALTNHLLAGFTAREVLEQTVVPMDGREALRTHAIARLDGVPRELLFYVMKKDECIYDIALVTPTGDSFDRALESFEPFVAGFRTADRVVASRESEPE